ncbi:class I SAM-dependent methyltransferase [Micromonospora lupini]|uniref:class I SAM-dependent methyltransferase n=1 Tax=Micromonospora lupini TaxID=285679 RepID=UPI0009FF5BDD|nr:class I SAM-dependent methyltransferase [Micromonospora lupini]
MRWIDSARTVRSFFSDVSLDVLDECRRTASGDGRCSFVEASADDLAGIADASVDVVTTRSVLIYSDRKAATFAEFFRVLRPGGRISLFEPINRFVMRLRPDDLFGVGTAPVHDLITKVSDVYRGTNEELTRPMMDFDERDIVDWAVTAGFEAVELDYRAQVDVPADPIEDWETLKCVAPNPLVPTYGEAIAAALTHEERERLDTYMIALAAAGTPTRRTMATAFLRARRPHRNR